MPLGHQLIKQYCNTHSLLWHWWVMAFTEDELHVCADWDEHLFLQDWLLTFCSAICADAPSNRLERAHRRGVLQHAHLPLSPQFAVPCGAPDVACRIIHTHALMKVSIWPHMHILSPQNQICMGKLERKTTILKSCCGISNAAWAIAASSSSHFHVFFSNAEVMLKWLPLQSEPERDRAG